VLALSGVSYLAFAEPPLYSVLYLLLIGLLIFFCMANGIWTMGIAVAERAARLAVIEYKPEPSKELPFGTVRHLLDAISESAQKLVIPNWSLAILLLLGVYLTVLRAVPTLRDSLEKPVPTSHQTNSPQAKHKVP
jgi:hypothetical protein